MTTLLQQAREALESHRLEFAIELYERAARENPCPARVYAEMAAAYARLGKVRRAVESYLRASLDFEDRNELSEALALCGRALELNPIALPARDLQRRLYHKLGNEHAYISASLALSRLHIESSACPFEPLLEPAQRYPDNLDIRLALAEACLATGQIDRAADELRQAATRALRGRELEAAETALRRLWVVRPPGESSAAFWRGLELGADSVSDLAELIRTLMHYDEIETAIFLCERLLLHQPDNPTARAWLTAWRT